MDDVVGFGSLNVDYIYETEDLTFLEPFYPKGVKRREWVLTDPEEIRALQGELARHTRLVSRTGGGSAANTVFALARMGFSSGMLGKVGRDADGEFLQEEMALLRRLRLKRGQRTGNALILLGPDRDRIILLVPNANRELTWEDVDPEFVREFRVLHMTSILGEGLALQERLARECAGRMTISCDPGEVYAQRGVEALSGLLGCCDLLFITQGEVELLTGREWREGLRLLLDCGVRSVIVKLKGSGSLIRQSERAWEIPAPVVQARDTTGAGDVFAAGFLGGHLRGLALPACGALGLAMARQSMAGVGRAAYPTKTDFEQVLGQVAHGTVPESF